MPAWVCHWLSVPNADSPEQKSLTLLDTGRFASVTTFIKQTREVRTLVVQPLASEPCNTRTGSTGMHGELGVLRR